MTLSNEKETKNFQKYNLQEKKIEYTSFTYFCLAKWLAVGFIKVELLVFEDLGSGFVLQISWVAWPLDIVPDGVQGKPVKYCWSSAR